MLKVVLILLGLLLLARFFPRSGSAGKRGRAARKTASLIWLALLYLFFRGIGGHGFLDPIEGINASVALNMLMGGNFVVPMVGGHLYVGNTMGYWWLSALSLSVFGLSEFAMRFWSVVGGLGMAAAGWLIALRVGGERSANYAAVLIGTSLLVYVTSQLASPHALYAFFVTMSLTGAVYALRNERFFILLHISAILAFVVYGPSGIALPWLSLLAYAVLARQEHFFTKALFFWPGLLLTVVIGGGYIIFLGYLNPNILTFMLYNISSEAFSSAYCVLFVLVAGFIPWTGVLPGAVKSALPLRRGGNVLPDESQSAKALLLVWSAVFLFFGALSRDALLLVAPLPALGVLCANYLAEAVEKKNVRLLQRVVALEIILLVPFLFVGLTWIYTSGNELMRHTLMSVIPWAFFCFVFLYVGWKYARARRPRELMLFMSMLALIALLPLAGVFNLLGENLSVRSIGRYLSREIRHDDLLLQNALNHPSLYFYVRRPGLTSTLLHANVYQRMVGQNVVDNAEMNRMWEGEGRVFMLLSRNPAILGTLPRVVYSLYEARDIVVLSNRRDM